MNSPRATETRRGRPRLGKEDRVCSFFRKNRPARATLDSSDVGARFARFLPPPSPPIRFPRAIFSEQRRKLRAPALNGNGRRMRADPRGRENPTRKYGGLLLGCIHDPDSRGPARRIILYGRAKAKPRRALRGDGYVARKDSLLDDSRARAVPLRRISLNITILICTGGGVIARSAPLRSARARARWMSANGRPGTGTRLPGAHNYRA